MEKHRLMTLNRRESLNVLKFLQRILYYLNFLNLEDVFKNILDEKKERTMNNTYSCGRFLLSRGDGLTTIYIFLTRRRKGGHRGEVTAGQAYD